MRDESVAISAVTRAEMRTGQMRMATNDKRLVSIDQMLQLLPALDWTSICADLYGRIHSFLATTGQPISICDVQIAAHALAENLTLVTHTTRRFERIERLRLEDWTGLESL